MTLGQQSDLNTSVKNKYLMVYGLSKNYGNMPQVANRIGFSEGGVSEWPAFN